MAKIDCSPMADTIAQLVHAHAQHESAPNFDTVVERITKDYPEVDRKMILESLSEFERSNSPGPRVMSNLSSVRREYRTENKLLALANKLTNQLRGIDAGQNKEEPTRSPRQTSRAIETARQVVEELKAQIPKTAKETAEAHARRVDDLQSQIKDLKALQEQIKRGDYVPLEKDPRRLDKQLQKMTDERDVMKGDVRRWMNSKKPRTLYDTLVRQPTRALGSILVTPSFGHAFVHGVTFAGSHPVLFVNDFIKSLGGSMTKLGEAGLERQMRERANYLEYRTSGLRLSERGLGQREEMMLSAFVEKAPPFAQFSRFYRQFLNHARADMYDVMKESIGGGELTRAESKAIAHMANVWTGWGDSQSLNGALNALGEVAFAPRLYLSRLQILTFEPLRNAPTARVKMAVAKQYARYMVAYGVLTGVGALTGMKTEENPLSAAFGKLNWGGTKFDFTGGMASYLTFAGRMLTGEMKTADGKVKPMDRGQTMTRFVRGKLAPLPSMATDLVLGRDYLNEQATVGGELTKYLFPLGARDIYEVFKNGDMGASATWAKAALTAIGLNGRAYGLMTPEGNFKAPEDMGKTELKNAQKRSRDEKNKTLLHPVGAVQQIESRLGMREGILTEAQYKRIKAARNQYRPQVPETE